MSSSRAKGLTGCGCLSAHRGEPHGPARQLTHIIVKPFLLQAAGQSAQRRTNSTQKGRSDFIVLVGLSTSRSKRPKYLHRALFISCKEQGGERGETALRQCRERRYKNVHSLWETMQGWTNWHVRLTQTDSIYTGCNRRNGPDFGRVFLMNYTEKPQNTYIQSWTVWEIMASEVWNFDSCYTLTDYQIRIETGRNMWFL